MAEISGDIHHINLSVTDSDRSADWYEEVFGLKRFVKLDDEQGRWSKIILQHTSGLLVGLTQHQTNEGEGFDEVRTGMDHVAFSVSDDAALDDWERHLHDLGVTHSEIRTSPLGRLIVIRDPDNIQLEVYAAKPSGRVGAIAEPRM